MQEMIELFSWPVILVNNKAISRNRFLNKLTCSLVISLGMAARFSKNSSKRSRSLSCFFKKSLQYSPLKVALDLGVSSSYRILDANE
jgi:hypothetical protein